MVTMWPMLWRIVLVVLGVAVIVRTESGDENVATRVVANINSYRRAENAADMARVAWDTGLANLAGSSSEPCESMPEGLGVITGASIDALAPKYFKQKYSYDHTQAKCNIEDCSIYLQIVFSKLTEIGCGSAPCGPNGNPGIRCFFNKKIDVNVAPYKLGAGCSACPSELSECEDGLCHAPSETPTTITTTSTTIRTTTITTEPTTETKEPTTTTIEPTTTTTQPITTTVTTTTTEEPNTTTMEPTTTTTQPTTTTTTPTTITTTEPTTTTIETTTSTTLTTITTEPTTTSTETTTPTTLTTTTTTEPTTSTTEPTTTATQPTTTTTEPTTTLGVSPVGLLMKPLATILENKENVTNAVKEQVSNGLNKYCCKNTQECCEAMINVKVEDCEKFTFIRKDGVRFTQGGLTSTKVNNVDMAMHGMYAVTKKNNALCEHVKQSTQGARRRRATVENERVVSPQILHQSMKELKVKVEIEKALSQFSIVVTVQAPKPAARTTFSPPTDEKKSAVAPWVWAIVSVAVFVLLVLFFYAAVVCSLKCNRKKSTIDDHWQDQYNSRSRLSHGPRQSSKQWGWEGEEQWFCSKPDTIGHAMRYSSNPSSYRGGSIGTGSGMFEQQENGNRHGMRGDSVHWQQYGRRAMQGHHVVTESLYTDSAAPYGGITNYEQLSEGRSNKNTTPVLFPRVNC